MCGICGVMHLDGRPVDARTLEQMNELLRHRGPDDRGSHTAQGIGLAMRRLAIIDLELGRQPITNEAGDLTIVFNGEIYNFPDLRDELLRRGHRFKTSSDTETILHAYEQWGRDCLTRLDGMFAFAIWDARGQQLFVARDRLGEKPLYYHADDKRLLFASELKALLAYPELDRAIDLVALDQYFTYLSIPAPATIFRSIKKLEPGHYLVASPNGAVERCRYWEPPTLDHPNTENIDRRLDEFDALFDGAVHKRLIADVPIGAFLSGGLDSSLVVAAMARVSAEPVKTFAVGFEGPGYFNELSHARTVATHLRTDHHEIVVRPDVAADLPKLVWHWDEPFAVSSAVPTYYLARAAREHVKVVLTGDGCDELFAGYPRYRWDYVAGQIRRYVPSTIGAAAGAALALAGSRRGLPGARSARRAAKFLNSVALPPDQGYALYLTNFDADSKRLVYSNALLAELATEELDQAGILARHYVDYKGRDRLNRLLYADLKTTLADEMLAKVDRMTMAVGLEARPPFLDRELVEWALRLPGSAKLRDGVSKYLVKRLADRRLPRHIVHRPKHGFEVPLDHWLKSELRELTRDYLSSQTVRHHGLFNADAVSRLLRAHEQGADGLGHRIWAILVFQMWWEASRGGAAVGVSPIP